MGKKLRKLLNLDVIFQINKFLIAISKLWSIVIVLFSVIIIVDFQILKEFKVSILDATTSRIAGLLSECAVDLACYYLAGRSLMCSMLT